MPATIGEVASIATPHETLFCDARGSYRDVAQNQRGKVNGVCIGSISAPALYDFGADELVGTVNQPVPTLALIPPGSGQISNGLRFAGHSSRELVEQAEQVEENDHEDRYPRQPENDVAKHWLLLYRGKVRRRSPYRKRARAPPPRCRPRRIAAQQVRINRAAVTKPDHGD